MMDKSMSILNRIEARYFDGDTPRADLTDARLEQSVVHELVHILLHEAVGDPTDADRRGHIERVTTMTARAILRARDGEAQKG